MYVYMFVHRYAGSMYVCLYVFR